MILAPLRTFWIFSVGFLSVVFVRCQIECDRPVFNEELITITPDEVYYTEYQVVEFSCQDNVANLVGGANRLVCLPSGMWSVSGSICTPSSCSTLLDCLGPCSLTSLDDDIEVINEEVVEEGELVRDGTVVMFRCNGTLVGGDSALTCSDTSFDGDLPSCLADCRLEDLAGYPIPANSNDTTRQHGEMVTYQCGSESIDATCNDGTWLSDIECFQFLECDRPVFNEELMTVSPDQVYYTELQVVEFSCLDNFANLVGGVSLLTCQPSGLWFASGISCNSSSCSTSLDCLGPCSLTSLDDDVEVINEEVVEEGELVRDGTVVMFRCNGALLGGNSALTCSDTTFDGNLPVCIADCRLDDLEGYLIPNNSSDTTRQHGEMVTYQCVSESIEATCNDGTWLSNDECPPPGKELILHCASSSFQVDIAKELIGGAYNATDFYLSGDPYDVSCRGFYTGVLYISLNSSLTRCGTQFVDNGTHLLYQNTVEISPSGHNSLVDFLGLEIAVSCEYNTSTRVQAYFKPSDKVIRKKEKGSFEFDFAMYTDITYSTRYYPAETISLNEELYFRAELLRSASNLEIHLRSCRATPSPNYDDNVVYEFISAGCGINNSPVRVLAPNQPNQADFEITSFRFRKDLNSPDSQIWIHCEVIVCDVNDNNSECRHGCEQSRHRRSVEGPPTKAKRIVQGPISLTDKVKVLRTQRKGDSPQEVFTTILLAVSFVMLIGLVVMGVALRTVIRNSKKQEYQPEATTFGETTA